jgi:hypothetical protein
MVAAPSYKATDAAPLAEAATAVQPAAGCEGELDKECERMLRCASRSAYTLCSANKLSLTVLFTLTVVAGVPPIQYVKEIREKRCHNSIDTRAFNQI